MWRPGQCPAERSVCCGVSPVSTTAEIVSTMHVEGTWTFPEPRLPHTVVFCNVWSFTLPQDRGAQIPGARHPWQLKSVPAPSSLFLGTQSGPSPCHFSGT